MTNVICAGGVIFKTVDHQHFVLLIIKEDGSLVFPKGHVEIGETLEQAAVREVCEETGLQDIVLGQKLGVVIRPSTEKTGEDVTKEIHYFLMTSTTMKQSTADEEHGWFSIGVAMQKLKYQQEKEFLKRICSS